MATQKKKKKRQFLAIAGVRPTFSAGNYKVTLFGDIQGLRAGYDESSKCRQSSLQIFPEHTTSRPFSPPVFECKPSWFSPEFLKQSPNQCPGAKLTPPPPLQMEAQCVFIKAPGATLNRKEKWTCQEFTLLVCPESPPPLCGPLWVDPCPSTYIYPGGGGQRGIVQRRVETLPFHTPCFSLPANSPGVHIWHQPGDTGWGS